MKKLVSTIIACLGILQALTSCSQAPQEQSHFDYLKTDTTVTYAELTRGFLNPPDQARLRSLWKWANSLVTKESITRDLEEFRKKGWGGVLINDGGNSSSKQLRQEPPWDATGPLYLSPEWRELYQHAVREAERLGMEITSVMGSGWNPGGPAITPEFAVKRFVFAETEVKGGKTIQMELPLPDTLLMYRDVAIHAIKNQTMDVPTQDEAITDWTIKTMNKSFGAQGNYPMHILREWEEKADVPVIKKSDILDITRFFDGEHLTWDAPEGNWLIIRYGWTCKGTQTSTTSKGWSGLSMDHLNLRAFELFSDSVIKPILESAQSAGNAVKYIWTDSWEMGVTNWTNEFPSEFKKFRGYEINDFLPVLAGRVVESQELSNRFLRDFRRTVSDCIREYHYQPFADLAHEYGVGFHPESGGPHAAPIDAMEMMGVSDFPMGEFWIRSNTHRVSDVARFFVKQSASVAHTNGQRLNGGEGPQTIGPKWERAPKDMKHDLDRAFCSGVNRLFWTNSISSPPEFGVPGVVNFAANQLNPNITWWEQAGDFIQYINRTSYMLQQGLFVADVLYYYGDDVPNFVFLKEEYEELNIGYDWDKCSKDVILNRASTAGGRIVLPDGMSYSVLVLAPEESINLDVLKKVEQLVKDGATVVSPKPAKATGLTNFPQSDREVQEIANRVWGDVDGKTVFENRYGKGRVIWGKDINAVLASMGVGPDFSFKSQNEKTFLEYIHRRTAGEDIYYVVNRFAHHGIDDFGYYYVKTLPDRYEAVDCAFRVTGKVPELWDPVTGEIKQIMTYREENGQTIIPLHFEPEGSFFVVFREGKAEDHIVKISKDNQAVFPIRGQAEVKPNPTISTYKRNNALEAVIYEPGSYNIHWSNGKTSQLEVDQTGREIEIVTPWQVHFDPKWGGPESVIFSELKSWLEFEDPGIKYYSGKATYVNSFDIRTQDIQEKRVILDLGMVQELAVVRLNGHAFPVSWMPPFRLDVTEFLEDGKNELEVDIINQWPNRIIGDSKSPESERYTRTNYKKFDQPDSEKYLRESGLIGPVKLQLVATRKLN